MITLISVLALFVVWHVAPTIPHLKAQLRQGLGRAYGLAYGVVSTILLIAVIYTFRDVDRPDIFEPPEWGRHANFLLTLFGFICLGIFLFRGSWRNRLRYPMAIGVMFWGIGHLLANGDAGSLVFFGGLMLASAFHAWMLSLGGFAPSDERGGHNLLSVLFGIALYGVFAQLHGAVIGMPVVNLVH